MGGVMDTGHVATLITTVASPAHLRIAKTPFRDLTIYGLKLQVVILIQLIHMAFIVILRDMGSECLLLNVRTMWEKRYIDEKKNHAVIIGLFLFVNPFATHQCVIVVPLVIVV